MRNYVDAARRLMPLRRCVCLGDSLTRGTASANYVEHLRALVPTVEFLNYGVNGALAGDLRANLPNVEADAFVLMVGTNDVRYAVDQMGAARPTQRGASPDTFATHVEAIVQTLKRHAAKVVLVSIPPIAEVNDDPLSHAVLVFNFKLSEIAARETLDFVDVTSEMLSQLASATPRRTLRGMSSIYTALALRYIFRLSWNTISRLRGTHFHTDAVHLNDRAARIIANKIAAALNTRSD